MIYITKYQRPKRSAAIQYTWDDLFDGMVNFDKKETRYAFDPTGTYTIVKEQVEMDLALSDLLVFANEKMDAFLERYKNLYEVNRNSLYETFYIPKRSGGLRKIDAPNEELKCALREVKCFLEDNLDLKYHTSAFAYIKGRNTIAAVKKHQSNASRWFLKTDFSNFFGSTTKEFVLKMFGMIYPMNKILDQKYMREKFEKILDLCFLNGGLPQGTPVSPTITNIMMIPIDHALFNKFNKDNFIYTRYADDIIVSHRYDFKFTDKVNEINEVLRTFDAPFRIKSEKTRYGSSAGKNFNLGVMLNKDNEITIGHEKKKRFKAMCCNFIMDTKHNISWSREDLEQFQGIMSYYRMVEREAIDSIIEKANQKFAVDMLKLLKEQINI